jgi:hypothetical protein
VQSCRADKVAKTWSAFGASSRQIGHTDGSSGMSVSEAAVARSNRPAATATHRQLVVPQAERRRKRNDWLRSLVALAEIDVLHASAEKSLLGVVGCQADLGYDAILVVAWVNLRHTCCQR